MKQFLGKVKFWMDKFLSIACAVLLSFMTILVLIQVFSRYVLNSPVAFTEELVRYSLIWTGFIGAAYAFSTREHMSLTLVRDKFTGKAHTALLVAIDGLILLLAIFVITIGGFKLAVSASRILRSAGHPPQSGVLHRSDFRHFHHHRPDHQHL